MKLYKKHTNVQIFFSGNLTAHCHCSLKGEVEKRCHCLKMEPPLIIKPSSCPFGVFSLCFLTSPLDCLTKILLHEICFYHRFKMKWDITLSLKRFMMQFEITLSGWYISTNRSTSPHLINISLIVEQIISPPYFLLLLLLKPVWFFCSELITVVLH